jgi:4-diphosphocytidyl-2-C-methyl-D-erythritol kinase
LIAFPNCKINLGLHILGKRADGYHNLETVFYPVAVHDALEIIREPGNESNIYFSTSGLEVPGSTSDNICIKAWHLLKKDFPQLPPVRMHLHKVIPMGAGLGGGSADGAHTLLSLNRQFALGLKEDGLAAYALQLGSDCPFFIKNQTCFATGRGEVFEPIPVDLSEYKILLVNPGIHVPTRWAFAQLNPDRPHHPLKEIITCDVITWRGRLMNDFELPVSRAYPEIASIRDKLYASGALYAAMSGSGSTLFGIFRKEDPVQIEFPDHYFVRTI